jgi:hypothetical protein
VGTERVRHRLIQPLRRTLRPESRFPTHGNQNRRRRAVPLRPTKPWASWIRLCGSEGEPALASRPSRIYTIGQLYENMFNILQSRLHLRIMCKTFEFQILVSLELLFVESWNCVVRELFACLRWYV